MSILDPNSAPDKPDFRPVSRHCCLWGAMTTAPCLVGPHARLCWRRDAAPHPWRVSISVKMAKALCWPSGGTGGIVLAAVGSLEWEGLQVSPRSNKLYPLCFYGRDITPEGSIPPKFCIILILATKLGQPTATVQCSNTRGGLFGRFLQHVKTGRHDQLNRRQWQSRGRLCCSQIDPLW